MNDESTSLSPLGLFLLAVLAIQLWRAPRERAIVPLLLTTIFLPLGQGMVVLGLNFPIFRLLLLLGMLRIFIRREWRDLNRTRMDRLFLAWSAVVLIASTLMRPTMPQFINTCGFLYNALCGYFITRCFVRTLDSVMHSIRWLGYATVVLAGFMLVEKVTGRNFFAIFGGVPEETVIREGKLRAQGAFRHPIITGTFGSTTFALVAALWCKRERRRLAIIGCLACGIVVVAASSSGALLALLAATGALFCWPLRRSLHWLRRTAIALCVLLSLFMSAPPWFILAKVADITGGTGWHRAYIIDAAISHAGEWFLVGTPVTVHWGGYPPPPNDPENIDITNQFIFEAVKGGILRLILFVALIVTGFQQVSRWTNATSPPPVDVQWIYWCVGLCLFTHTVSFFSVSYFDQMVFLWYWLLAVISGVAAARRASDKIDIRDAPVEAVDPVTG